ncbi:chaperone modulator CbpM [Christiangramia salexigens]|nr:chaperone modulator CbpM [Christiangramia salexigens]
MKEENLIPAEEICVRYKVEHQFLISLYESGIIDVITIEKTQYIPLDHLHEFEKMIRLYRDLDINVEGLEAVHHLLKQIESLQKENRRLRNRLNLFE